MLDKFIDVYCNNNLKALIKSGEPTNEELLLAWEDIQTKYIEIIGGSDFTERVSLVKEIQELSFKVEKIEFILEVLSIAPTDGIYSQLFDLGYTLPQLPYNEANIGRICKMVTSNMKRDVAQVQILSKRLHDEQKGGETKVTEESFYNILVEIADTFKVVLKESETNVMTFAMYIKKYKDKAEQIAKQNIKSQL